MLSKDKSRGLIDGVEIQCHQFNIDTLSTSTMQSNPNALARTGLPIYVSELDITGDDATQLSRYQEKFPVLYNHSSVRDITLRGYIQGQTWKTNTHLVSSGKLRLSYWPVIVQQEITVTVSNSKCGSGGGSLPPRSSLKSRRIAAF